MNKTVSYPTHKMSWVWYIAQSLGRVAYFRPNNEPRALNVWNALYDYVSKHAPSGSGLDSGTFLSDASTTRKLVFVTSFHHMDEHGGYDGWTEHKVVVTPEFQGYDIRVLGRDRNGIKDYLADTFRSWLSSEADHPALVEYLTD